MIKFISFCTFCVLFCSNLAFSQWTVDGNNAYISITGNLGIGTTTPKAKLHIPNGAAIIGSDISFPATTNSTLVVISKDNNATTYPFYVGQKTGKDLFWVSGNGNSYFLGNVGIGTTTVPVNRLEIGSNNPSGWSGNDLVLSNSNGALAIYNSPTHTYLYGTNNIAIQPGGKMTIYATSSGNVGIGTTQTGAYKLAVEGKIACRSQLRIFDPGVAFPDYVFEKNYMLRPLNEVKKYIEENKHLPEIPSAKEIEKQGIELIEMNTLLLKKVEEMTLYLIQQQEQIQELKKQMNEFVLEKNK